MSASSRPRRSKRWRASAACAGAWRCEGEARGVTVYDDFAHHPTAIRTTLEGLRQRVGKARILAVLEPRSNTMKRGVMKDALPREPRRRPTGSTSTPRDWAGTRARCSRRSGARVRCEEDLEALIAAVAAEARAATTCWSCRTAASAASTRSCCGLARLIVYLHGFNSSPAVAQGAGDAAATWRSRAGRNSPARRCRRSPTKRSARSSKLARTKRRLLRRLLARRLLRHLPRREARLPARC